MPPIPRDRETMELRANAELRWGRSPEEVERMLMGWGMPPPDAKAFVRSVKGKRDNEFRLRGMLQLIGGGIGVVVVGIVFFALAQVASVGTDHPRAVNFRGMGQIGGALALVGVASFGVFLRGLFRVVLGGSGESDAALDE